jgi:hypothetical protein
VVVLGVDTDSKGSLAILDTCQATLDLYRVPSLSTTMTTGKNRSSIDYCALPAILVDLISHVDVAFLERQWGRQGEAAGGAFSFGAIYGALYGSIATAFKAAGKEPSACVKTVLAADWKHAMKIDADKKQAVALATLALPACKHGWTTKRGNIISAAEATLIALYGASISGVKLDKAIRPRPVAYSKGSLLVKGETH